MCQMYAAHLACIKQALCLKYSSEGNPGKVHYLSLISFMKSVPILEEGKTNEEEKDGGLESF